MDVRNQVGHTAVHYAVQAGAQQALAVLLSTGANPSFVSLCDCMLWDNLPKGSSPLHVAARRNEPALAMQLLKAYVSATSSQATASLLLHMAQPLNQGFDVSAIKLQHGHAAAHSKLKVLLCIVCLCCGT
jgi:ankyrin repeat protein